MAAHSSKFLASHTVHVTSEANARPTMTAWTRMSADMNIDQGERSRGRLALPTTGRLGGAAGVDGSWPSALDGTRSGNVASSPATEMPAVGGRGRSLRMSLAPLARKPHGTPLEARFVDATGWV